MDWYFNGISTHTNKQKVNGCAFPVVILGFTDPKSIFIHWSETCVDLPS